MAETVKPQPVIEENFGYPSHFIDPAIKQTPEYARKYIGAIDSEYNKGSGNFVFRARAEEYAEWRAYAKGDQSIDQYKRILLNPKHKREGGKKNRDRMSYKNLDWSILPIAPKFVNVLVGRLISQDNGIGVKAVDPKAVNARRQKKLSMQEFVINQKFLQEVSDKTGIQFDSPLEDDVIPAPTNLAEIDLHMEMFYKEHYCLQLMDMLKLLNTHDNYDQILKEVADDLVKVGIAATRTYRIGDRIKRRRCIPERMVTNHCKSEDFKDFQHGGEYWDLTIGQLRELAGNQFTEEEYKKIAEKITGREFNISSDYFDKNQSYPYDHIRITVLDAVWFSPDQETYQVKPNQYGNMTVYEKDWNWISHVSTDEFNNSPINQANKSTIVRRTLNNLYQGMLVVGTEYVFNYGKCKDMLRNESNIGTTIGPFTIYSLGFDSIMRQLKTVFDNIQRNWLQYQHHINKSRPMGMDIEYTALQDISIGGKSGEKMSPKEVLELYFDTGILLWRRKDWGGQSQNNNWRPVNELNNGLSAAAAEHFRNIINEIDLLRSIIGLNELTDASTPNSETGKFVGQQAIGAVDHAVKYLHHAFDQINIGTQLRTVMHISAMAQNGMAPDYTEAIGLDSMMFLASMSEMGAHEYGIYLLRQPSVEMKQRLSLYVSEAIRAQTLLPEEAFEIEEETNPYRAIKLLKMYRKQKEQAKMREMEQTYKLEAQKNVESVTVSETEKRKTMEFEWTLKGKFEFDKNQAEILKNRELLRDQIVLAKLQAGQELTKIEAERVTKIMTEDTKGEWNMMIAQANNEAKAKEAKNKPAVKKK
jgi:hypothetical protein